MVTDPTKADTPPKAKKARKRSTRKKPKANGRPRFQPSEANRGSVKALSAAGYPEEDIASYLKISAPTLRKYFRDELAFATMELLGGAVGGLAVALKNNEAWAICFVLKTRGKKLHGGAGWSEKIEVGGEAGLGIPIRLESLNDAQLDKLLARIQTG